MKSILILLLVSNVAFSQIMSEHIYKYENSINPIFSNTSKQILITFDKNSLIDASNQFNYLFKIDISDRKSELSGITATNGFGVLGGILSTGFSSSKQISIKNTNGYVLLNKSSFDSLVKYSNKIIEIMKLKSGPQNFNSSYFFKLDKLEMSLEIEQTKTDIEYLITKNVYLKIDESVFVLTEEEFKKLYKETINNIKGMWDSY